MAQHVRSLLDVFPLAPTLPILSPPHPVHFPGFAEVLTAAPFAAFVTAPRRLMHIAPWHPTQNSLPEILSAILQSLQHPCPQNEILLLVAYIWLTPAAQVLVAQDRRLGHRTWAAFCEIISDAYPERPVMHPAQLHAVLNVLSAFFEGTPHTPLQKSRTVCRFREAFRIAGALNPVPIQHGEPMEIAAAPNAEQALLREGPRIAERIFWLTEATWDSSLNAIIQVFRLFDHPADEDIHDCAANVITLLLQAQRFAGRVTHHTQELEELLQNARIAGEPAGDLPVIIDLTIDDDDIPGVAEAPPPPY